MPPAFGNNQRITTTSEAHTRVPAMPAIALHRYGYPDLQHTLPCCSKQSGSRILSTTPRPASFVLGPFSPLVSEFLFSYLSFSTHNFLLSSLTRPTLNLHTTCQILARYGQEDTSNRANEVGDGHGTSGQKLPLPLPCVQYAKEAFVSEPLLLSDPSAATCAEFCLSPRRAWSQRQRPTTSVAKRKKLHSFYLPHCKRAQTTDETSLSMPDSALSAAPIVRSRGLFQTYQYGNCLVASSGYPVTPVGRKGLRHQTALCPCHDFLSSEAVRPWKSPPPPLPREVARTCRINKDTVINPQACLPLSNTYRCEPNETFIRYL
ncbi:hypothetical protein L209DRAFT_529354 [Thermothelomyces heterothallicus CBS 203.75]